MSRLPERIEELLMAIGVFASIVFLVMMAAVVMAMVERIL